jgi:hypothetical protein
MAALELLGAPVSLEQPCECCQVPVRFVRIKTPDAMPDFYKTASPDAWFGWQWSGPDGALALVTACSRACLTEWFIDQTIPGV